jgi:hypothetical protein
LPIKQFKALPKSIQELLISTRVPISISGSVERDVSKDAMKTAPPDSVAVTYDWGNHNGLYHTALTFNGYGITSASLAFVSASTSNNDADVEIYSVSVHDNVVSVNYYVDWSSPLDVHLAYFVVIVP